MLRSPLRSRPQVTCNGYEAATFCSYEQADGPPLGGRDADQGALGAPEALPYLIEWASDADAELGAAARAAMTQIHQSAGTGK